MKNRMNVNRVERQVTWCQDGQDPEHRQEKWNGNVPVPHYSCLGGTGSKLVNTFQGSPDSQLDPDSAQSMLLSLSWSCYQGKRKLSI